MSSRSRSGLLSAAGAGAVAYLLGYVFTYVLSSSAVLESDTWQFVESVSDGAPGWKVIGWVFYNGHFSDTTIRIDTDIPFLGGTETLNLIAEAGLSNLLYVLPPALLVAAGLFAATMAGVGSVRGALTVGPAVAIGYLPLAVAGVFLFRITVESSFAGPTLVTGVGLAGLVYPLVFGTVGAGVAALLAGSDSPRSSPA